MKKTLLTMLMIASCFGAANAQLMVDENGHVGVAVDESSTMSSYMGVNSTGSPLACFYARSNPASHRIALSARRYGNNTSQSNQFQVAGQFMTEVYPSQYNMGLYSECYRNDSIGSGRTYGLLTVAGNATDGWNFGVCASLWGNNGGAAIYGSSKYSAGRKIPGSYAGYFEGEVRVTKTLTANEIVTLSDYRVKENIKALSNSSSLDNLMNMNVVEYNYNENMIAPIDEGTDTLSVVSQVHKLDKEENSILARKHYGFIAQELQQIYPDLVKESQEGYLTINYLEIIPLLVSSIQELKAEINTLQAGNAPIYKAQGRTTDATSIDAVVTALYQNAPNPFTESTVIRVDVAEGVATADLYIYNMNGEQITEYPIIERGATSVTIDGGSLNAGMYLYALIADGQVIDTKRMILTK